MSGQMGKVISLFQQSQSDDNSQIEEDAQLAFNSLLEACAERGIGFSYADGLCGIGVGVEYLLQEAYIEGDANEVLGRFDSLLFRIITARPAIDTSIAHGMLGIAYYFYYRLKAQITSEAPHILRLKEHLIYLIDWIGDDLQDSSIEKNLYECYFILILLLQLNVFNAKVLNLLDYCEKEIALWKR